MKLLDQIKSAKSEEDFIELRVRLDGILRKMILGTFAICCVAIFGAWLWQQLH